VKSSGERLSGRIALGVLTRALPPELVDEVVAECGRVEQRPRLLPARVVVYFVLAMSAVVGHVGVPVGAGVHAHVPSTEGPGDGSIMNPPGTNRSGSP
jgi:hypothetical protein